MSDIASQFQRLMQPHIGWGQIIRRPDYTASRHAQLQKARREIAEGERQRLPVQEKGMPAIWNNATSLDQFKCAATSREEKINRFNQIFKR